MEWVETTGKTVAEALEAALDRLGVAETDAEVVVIEEPKAGIFRIGRSDARIRARVRPSQPRAKRPTRRPSAKGNGSGERARRPKGGGDQGTVATKAERPTGGKRSSTAPRRNANAPAKSQRPKEAGEAESPRPKTRARRSRSRGPTSGPDGASRGRGSSGRGDVEQLAAKEEPMSIEAQAEMAVSFVRGVVDGFGLGASVESSIDDDVIKVQVNGDGLGLLVGPRGATLDALQELTRTAVQHGSDEHTGRISVDVAGYRARRTAALGDFAQRVAGEVAASGQAQALEPMSAADRKVVHDTVAEMSGVVTSSEGEDPKRFVVIRPADRSIEQPEDGGSDRAEPHEDGDEVDVVVEDEVS